MTYQNIRPAIFIDRPNRFVAHIELDGRQTLCHVKNTGRCRELLVPGAHVLVQQAEGGTRKTGYDLIGVWKRRRLINIDSSAPNRIFAEWVQQSGLFGAHPRIRAEYPFEDSRFDFYIEGEGKSSLIEVKGVTLEENGVARFPDAPTQRGVKHLQGLIRSLEAGYEAYLVFVVQMKGVAYVTANWDTHPAFGRALQEANRAGVNVLALDCRVTQDSIVGDEYVPVKFGPSSL